MIPFIPLAGAAISGASSILNGILGRDAAQDASEAAAARQAAAQTTITPLQAHAWARDDYNRDLTYNRSNEWRDADYTRSLENRHYNTEMQKEFARSGIQWRVQDALAAGIHPLAALGGSGAGYSPSPIAIGGGSQSGGGSTTMPVPNLPPVSGASLGPALGAMGQDIGRALMASASHAGRNAVFTDAVNELTVQNMTLKNEYLASQIARLRGQTGPAMPTGDFESWPGVHTYDDPEKMPRLNLGSGPIRSDPRLSNTEDFTKRYGEAADWIMGPYIMYRDYMHNTGGIGQMLLEDWDRMKARDRRGSPMSIGSASP